VSARLLEPDRSWSFSHKTMVLSFDGHAVRHGCVVAPCFSFVYGWIFVPDILDDYLLRSD